MRHITFQKLSWLFVQLVFVVILCVSPAGAEMCSPDGDVNQDGSTTPSDALLAFQHFLGIAESPLDSCQQQRANVENPQDSAITPADALCIFQRFLDLPSCLDTPNTPPTANAGIDQEVVEFAVVTLDGSGSSDTDGSIAAYQWAQVANGAPSVTLANANAAQASFSAPDVVVNEVLLFQLSVTDNHGESATDTVEVLIHPTPGVLVGDVSGNTVTLNATAEFSVSLLSQPGADVTIPIASSNVNEGVTEVDTLVFTPTNWDQAQTIVVRGTNANVQNGQQNYLVVLSPSQSADNLYHNIDPDDVVMKGITLELSPPANLTDVIAESEVSIQPLVTYTGQAILSFALTQAPAGMNIDLSSGLITWTPQTNDEGHTVDVTVTANDGSLFDVVTFQMRVVQPVPIQSAIQDDALTVTDENTNLQGLSITASSSQGAAQSTQARVSTSERDISGLQLEKMPESSIPVIPSRITRLTDVFVVKHRFEGPIELRIPIPSLPGNSSLSDVSLYSYTKAQDIEEPFWSTVLVDILYEGTAEEPIAVIKLEGLHGLFFFGVQTASSSGRSGEIRIQDRVLTQRRTAAFVSVSDVICTPRSQPFSDELDYRRQDCTVSGKETIKTFVRDFGDSATSTRWHGTTIEELVSWLVEARSGFDSLGLSYDDQFNVVIESMDYLGYVTTGNNEKRRTLHITSSNYPKNTITGTAVHEYFHHAQGKSPLDNFELIIDGGTENRWIIEGTARWFEDYLFDDINTYVSKEGSGKRILEAGLNSRGKEGIERPYQRFSFFKYLSENCSDFETSYRNLINVDRTSDASGIAKLVSELPTASCLFGNHLGINKRQSLESAIVYYQYATLFRNKISLLDTNESDTAFRFDATNHQFSQIWLNEVAQWLNLTDDTIYKLNGVNHIPAAGAYSFRVNAIAGDLPEGKVAELLIDTNREIIVSITSSDNAFQGDTQIGSHPHTWFSTRTQSSYVYNFDGALPELFVTIVNPDLQSGANVEVAFKIRDEIEAVTNITSPQNGATVNNRVITVTGFIPEEVRDAVSRVIVTSNGIASETNMHGDGSFSADVVVSVGQNTIKAQAFSASATPVTNEGIVTVEGVENALGSRNALVASRVVLVLRWDSNGTDLDIYSTDKNGGTIWYADRTEGPGNLDFDDVDGFGPEVISYRATEDAIYTNGTFNIDVHYYRGSQITNYTLDVILNETEGSNRRGHKFASIVPHTQGNSFENGPTGSGNSRFNDLLIIGCSGEGVCSLSGFDASRLSQEGFSSNALSSAQMAFHLSKHTTVPTEISDSSYEKCLMELERTKRKSGYSNWYCHSDGSKMWY